MKLIPSAALLSAFPLVAGLAQADTTLLSCRPRTATPKPCRDGRR